MKQRFDEQFDGKLDARYQEVLKKAAFLVKLSVPQAFKDAKKAEMMEKIGKGVSGKLNFNIALFKNRSTVEGGAAALQRTLTTAPKAKGGSTNGSRRGSINSSDGQSMRKIGSGVQRRKTVLLNEATISKRDTEVDWKDRLKQWKQRQQTFGAVTSFEDQLKQ